MRVDLPDPFCPTRAWTSPGSMSKSTPRSACWPSKVFESEAISRAAVMAALEFRTRRGASPRSDAPEGLVGVLVAARLVELDRLLDRVLRQPLDREHRRRGLADGVAHGLTSGDGHEL